MFAGSAYYTLPFRCRIANRALQGVSASYSPRLTGGQVADLEYPKAVRRPLQAHQVGVPLGACRRARRDDARRGGSRPPTIAGRRVTWTWWSCRARCRSGKARRAGRSRLKVGGRAEAARVRPTLRRERLVRLAFPLRHLARQTTTSSPVGPLIVGGREPPHLAWSRRARRHAPRGTPWWACNGRRTAFGYSRVRNLTAGQPGTITCTNPLKSSIRIRQRNGSV